MHIHICMRTCISMHIYIRQLVHIFDFILDFERMHRLFCVKLVDVLRLKLSQMFPYFKIYCNGKRF